MYQHRDLTSSEKENFIVLFMHVRDRNPFMKRYFQNKLYVIIFPLILLGLTWITYHTTQSLLICVIGLILGLLSIQVNFIVSHLWAHALMLEYSLWNVDRMISEVGYLPFVMFYAFYHHHHTKSDNWMLDLLSYDSHEGAIATAVAHWESFSLFTISYPLKGLLFKLLLFAGLFFYSSTTTAFFLGYELGVILLPISHDWVHDRRSATYGIYHLLKFFEMIGIFAKKADHHKHHVYTHRTVYQGFTSSGLYSKFLDGKVDQLWDYIYDFAIKHNFRPYQLWYYIMGLIVHASIIVSISFLIYCS